ncbi:MAG: selenide, water dikinase SelD [Opitutaceae bacterium]|nr:selenide, water dikinase SelD [Opitutaceae bacterium]
MTQPLDTSTSTTHPPLTQFSHGAGCGCKIAPSILQNILEASGSSVAPDAALLVGNNTCDDAAVYQINETEAVISTTDFFMPIVDDPFDFGRIASVNAISDVYAMGGSPLMAIAILGWPIEELSPEAAGSVLDGSRSVCREAGISLAGGHSIDSPEPIFGLAVTGCIDVDKLKQNDTAEVGCKLYLTKSLGVGLITTAHKRGLASEEDLNAAKQSMLTLNRIGESLAQIESVKAMTDVTGFGLLGHLAEMCLGSSISAVIHKESLPVLPGVKDYVAQDCIPGGTNRNWSSYGHHISDLAETDIALLADPQTSGGLLVAVSEEGQNAFIQVANRHGLNLSPIGELIAQEERLIQVI